MNYYDELLWCLNWSIDHKYLLVEKYASRKLCILRNSCMLFLLQIFLRINLEMKLTQYNFVLIIDKGMFTLVFFKYKFTYICLFDHCICYFYFLFLLFTSFSRFCPWKKTKVSLYPYFFWESHFKSWVRIFWPQFALRNVGIQMHLVLELLLTWSSVASISSFT